MLQDIRCKIGLHRWGPLQGDDRGAYHTCDYCGRTKRCGPDRPPEAHDRLDVHP